jgi:hypothetical protein
MKTQEFLKLLKENNQKSLIFEYQENKFAGTNYHLTEVKNVTFETIDCGGKVNDWKETHIQLWESPSEVGKEYYITTDKALAIFDRVNAIRPIRLETEAKIEFGNDEFHTSILSIDSIVSDEHKVKVKLFTDKTQCKAQELCGVLVEETSEATSESCAPGSGCC